MTKHKNSTIISSLLFMALISFANTVFATDYYLSNTGNDNSKGTSPLTPWQTINKLNTAKLKPGDRIFFKGGDRFLGEIEINNSGTDEKPIIISSYSNGEKPVLTGAKSISNFENYKTNIYKSKEEIFIKTLYINNIMQNIARYPNSGVLTFSNQDEFIGKSSKKTADNPNGKSECQFRDNNLNQPNGYWNGSSIRYRAIDWEWGVNEIVSWKDGIFTLKDSYRYGFSKGYGFILENKLEELDTIGEWCYDDKAKELFIYSENISNSTIEGVVYDYGIKLADNVGNIKISNLSF